MYSLLQHVNNSLTFWVERVAVNKKIWSRSVRGILRVKQIISPNATHLYMFGTQNVILACG